MLVNGLEFPHVQQHFDDDTSKENVIRTLFGSPRHRSPLFFSDLVGVFGNTDQIAELRERPEQQRSQIRPAVAINRRRGVADDARLLFQETTLEEMRFYAAPAIRGEVPDREHAALLWAALRLTTRWGSASSRGLGWSTIAVAVAWDGTPLEADDQLYTALRALVEREVQRT
jgi:CRISPR/Cas system CSM-associated protein Csm3 (group 7 of RAMP superfamily)